MPSTSLDLIFGAGFGVSELAGTYYHDGYGNSSYSSDSASFFRVGFLAGGCYSMSQIHTESAGLLSGTFAESPLIMFYGVKIYFFPLEWQDSHRQQLGIGLDVRAFDYYSADGTGVRPFGESSVFSLGVIYNFL